MVELGIYAVALVFVGFLSYRLGYMSGWDAGIQDWNKIRDR